MTGLLAGKVVLITGAGSGICRSAAQVFAAHGAMQPVNRPANPEEIAEAAAWLLADHASFVTGQVLAVDGGLVAQ